MLVPAQSHKVLTVDLIHVSHAVALCVRTRGTLAHKTAGAKVVNSAPTTNSHNLNVIRDTEPDTIANSSSYGGYALVVVASQVQPWLCVVEGARAIVNFAAVRAGAFLRKTFCDSREASKPERRDVSSADLVCSILSEATSLRSHDEVTSTATSMFACRQAMAFSDHSSAYMLLRYG